MADRPSTRAWKLALLGAILAVVAFDAFLTHWNPATGWQVRTAVHIDEFYHWGYATAMVETGSVTVTDAFGSKRVVPFSAGAFVHERGFQAYLGVFQELTGLSWTAIFTYGPLLASLLLALAVYALGERWGAGIPAAAAVVAIPTTLRFLGPGFLVPIAVALPLVVLAFHLAIEARGARGILAYLLVSAALWTIHAYGGLLAFLGGALLSLVHARKNPWRALALFSVASLPFLATRSYHAGLTEISAFGESLPLGLEDIRIPGLALGLLAVAGVAALGGSRQSERRIAGTVLTLLVAGGVAVIAYRAATGQDPGRLYDRTVLVLTLGIALLAGVGAAAIGRSGAALLRRRGPGPVPMLLALALLAPIVGSVVATQTELPLYLVLPPARGDAFDDAAPALGGRTHRALVDEPSSMPFTILTGVPAVFADTPTSRDRPPELEAFFANGASDTYFLLTTRATVVVTPRAVDNPDLVRIADGVYVLAPELLDRLPTTQGPL